MHVAVERKPKTEEETKAAGTLTPESFQAVLQQYIGEAWKRDPEDVKRAVAAIKELRKGITLGGLKIEDLRKEGRRF